MFFFICKTIFGFQIENKIPLTSLNVEHGLSQNYITCTLQDSEGFMWIGTRNGLYKYDGYNFIQIPLDNKYYGYNEINSLYKDNEMNIWIGTNNGPILYNHRTGEISSNLIPQITKGLIITSFLRNDKDVIWMGTSDGNLIRYQTDKQEIESFNYPNYSYVSSIIPISNHAMLISYKFGGVLMYNFQKNEFSVPAKMEDITGLGVYTMISLNSGTIIIATKDGTYFYREDGSLLKLIDQKEQIHPNSLKSVLTIFETEDNKIWLGTDGYGIIEYDILTGQLHNVYFDEPLPLRAITSIYKTDDQSIWIGTVSQGLKTIHPYKSQFNHWSYEKGNNTGLSSNSVLGICETENDDIVLALDGGGINLYDPISKKFKYYLENSEFQKINNSIIFDEDMRLWLGTLNHGSYILDLGNRQKPKPVHMVAPERLSYATVKCFLKDIKGNIWIGTVNDGIYKYTSKSNEITEFKKGHFINNLQINSLYQSTDSLIWIAGYNGLFNYNPSDQTLIEIQDRNGHSFKQLTSIIETDYDNLWIGSKNGLHHIERSTGQTTLYTTEKGLPSNVINSILLDAPDKLWLGTDRGLSQLDINSLEFRNFGKEDGIVGLEFNEAAALKSSNGMFYFGNTYGVYSFNPDEIKINPVAPKVVLTKFNLHDKGKIKTKPLIQKPINQVDEINLTHDQNFFTIHFTALNFTNSSKNQYKYRMVGIDDDWVNSRTERKANYTNIPPGVYEFQVKASNNDGLWSLNSRNIKIIISPPWWATVWAKLFFLILISSLLILIHFYIINQIKLKDALKIEKLEKNNQLKINEFKTKFFTNLTHELKTPLTMILSSLGKIMKSTPPDYTFYNELLSIERNSNNLSKLINEWFDYRKAKLNKTKLNVREINFPQFVEDIVNTFNDFAATKSISINFYTENSNVRCYFDPVKMEKVISNLISNGIKYSAQNSTIKVSVEKSKQIDNRTDGVYLRVKDNGNGISREKQDHIFKRFYDFGEDPSISTGIGLSLSKELVEMHNGKLEFTSIPGKGSIFSIFLPAGNDHFTVEQLNKSSIEQLPSIKTTNSNDIAVKKVLLDSKSRKIKPYTEFTILVVEDEDEIRKFIAKELSESFKVITANNGEEGFEIALEHIPDLILSDILMSKLTGLEFCKKIKTNLTTSHIPFILLTALSDEESIISGLNYGAEDYITKPFNINTLILKVKSILENRRNIISRYQNEMSMNPSDLARSNPDKVFLEKTVKVIHKNMADPNFTIDKLVLELAMSRTPFFKKIKTLTNLTPNEFTKTVRLRYAAQLLLTTNLNISEVSFEIGFLSTKHFRSTFKKQFGDTPTIYRVKNTIRAN